MYLNSDLRDVRRSIGRGTALLKYFEIRAEGEADNSYRDIDNFANHKNLNPIIVLLYISSLHITKTSSNNCLFVQFFIKFYKNGVI